MLDAPGAASMPLDTSTPHGRAVCNDPDIFRRQPTGQEKRAIQRTWHLLQSKRLPHHPARPQHVRHQTAGIHWRRDSVRWQKTRLPPAHPRQQLAFQNGRPNEAQNASSSPPWNCSTSGRRDSTTFSTSARALSIINATTAMSCGTRSQHPRLPQQRATRGFAARRPGRGSPHPARPLGEHLRHGSGHRNLMRACGAWQSKQRRRRQA